MGHKVLLADDSITVQKIVKLSLTEEGIEVIALGNGEQAVQQLETLQPDLVMADVFMPGKDGYEVCEFVKSHPQFKNTPVILLVHAFEPFDPDRAKQVRADQQLTKPFQSIRTLVNTVRDLLTVPQPSAVKEKDEQKAEAVRAMAAPEPSTPLVAVTPAINQTEKEFAVVSSLTSTTETMVESASAVGEIPQPELAAAASPSSFDFLTPLPSSESNLQIPMTDSNVSTETTDFLSPLELPTFPNTNWQPAADPLSEPTAPEFQAASLSSISLAPTSSLSSDGADDILDLSEVMPANQASLAAEISAAANLANDVSLLSVLAPVTEPQLTEENRIQTPSEMDDAAQTRSFDVGVGQIDLSTPLPAAPMTPIAGEASNIISNGTTASVPSMQNDTAMPIPEAVIEEIVQRVVQRLSTQAIQEIAWEVVPEMAELIIRKQISQQQVSD